MPWPTSVTLLTLLARQKIESGSPTAQRRVASLSFQRIDNLRAPAIEEHISVSQLPVVPMHSGRLELHGASDRRVSELFRLEISPYAIGSGDRIVSRC